MYAQDEWKATTDSLSWQACGRSGYLYSSYGESSNFAPVPACDRPYLYVFVFRGLSPSDAVGVLLQFLRLCHTPSSAAIASTVWQRFYQLAPEKIVSYEAGYQGWYWKHRLRLRANMFFNHITDLIIASDFP